MKRAALLLFVLCCAAPAFAQVTFSTDVVAFPHIDVGGDAAGLNYATVVQAVNANSTGTSGHLTLFSDSGAALSASFDGQPAASFLDFNLDSGATRQILISSSGAITGGWMQISYTPAEAETTVIIQYRAGVSVLTEVGITPQFLNPGQLPNGITATDFAAESDTSLNTGIAIANPNPASAALLRLWDPNSGSMLASNSVALPANGHVAKLLTELFPTVSNITQIRAQVSIDSCAASTTCSVTNFVAGPGLIATALRLNLSNNAFTSIPVIARAATTDTVRVLPQIAVGGDPNGVNFQTILYLNTIASNGVSGVADIFDDNGNPINVSANGQAPSSRFAFSVLSNRVMKIVLSGGNILQAGWVRLTLTGTVPLVVNAVYQTLNGSTVSSEASVAESPTTIEGVFYVNTTSGVENIGVALANAQPTPNPITLTLYNDAGFVVDTETVTLPAFGHLARFVDQIFPQLVGLATFDGSVSMQAPLGVSVVALRLTGPNIAAIPVAPSVMFLPSITNLTLTKIQRSPALLSYSINVADFSSSLVTSTSFNVLGEAEIYLGPNNQPDDQTIAIDGSSMVTATTGTLTGTFTSQYPSIPSGTQAVFYIYITDAAGNFSNIVSVPFKF